MEHARKLLDDDRLRVDTMRGRKPLALKRVKEGELDLKRLMAEAGKRDRDLQDRMPVGLKLEVEVLHKWLWVMRSVVARLRVLSVPPAQALLHGQPPSPTGKEAVLAAMMGAGGQEPVTTVLFSSRGFGAEARRMVQEQPGTATVLVEPNDAGGYNLYASEAARHLADLFDPELEDQKRQRVLDAIARQHGELTGSGISADKLAKQAELPMPLVESALRSYAKEHAGCVAKKLDGRLVLFREGSILPQDAAGGQSMPMIDRIRSLFGGRGENEKKIAFLSERRTALSQQRDRAYEEISQLEGKDNELKEQFKNAGNELAKRRVTSQLLQLRKDMERRQQLLGVLNQQINVVSTHLHNLELVQQGTGAKLPNSEEMAEDAAKAEEMLADLEASGDLASSIGVAGGMGMSDEEQALYDELAAETGATQTVKEPAAGTSIAGASQTATGKTQLPPIPPTPERQKERKRTEPEAG
jgi:hypothetical protein